MRCTGNVRLKYTGFQRLSIKKCNISQSFWYWLPVQMIIFWINWAESNISLKSMWYVSFFNVATKIFKITYVGHIIFLLDRAAPENDFWNS